MDIEVKPFEGVGPIKFGMSREEVIHVVGETPESFRKAKLPHPETDQFVEAAIMASYRLDAGCQDLEFTQRGSWWPHLVYAGFRLQDTPYARFLELVRKADPEAIIDDESFVSLKLGISMMLDSLVMDDEPAEILPVVYLSVFGPQTVGYEGLK